MSGNVQEMSKTFPRVSQWNFLEISRKCPGNVLEMSRNVLEMSWKCPGNVPKFPGNVREISRKCPEIFPEFSGKIQEIFKKKIWKFPDRAPFFQPAWPTCNFRVLGKSFREVFWRVLTCFRKLSVNVKIKIPKKNYSIVWKMFGKCSEKNPEKYNIYI